MNHCETYRAQMLEYLYDLLEAEERQALEAHLAECAACQAELARARRQQGLLATAARMGFSEVRFVAPPADPDPAAAPEPMVVPLARPRRAWRRWAAAAAVLLVLGGLVAPVAWYGHDYLQARRTADTKADALADARQRLHKLQTQLGRMPQERQQRLDSVRRALAEQQLRVLATGPATIPTGAPAEYQIETRTLSNQPVAARLSVQVMDGQQPLAKTADVVQLAVGRYRVTLPADLPVRPGSQPTLLVAAEREDGLSRAEVREELRLTAPVYLTHLATDKPMYQPGETVHFRSLTLDRASFKPAQEDFRLVFTLQPPQGPQIPVVQGSTTLVRGQDGGPVALGPNRKPLRGIGVGEYALPENAAGGEWVLSVRDEGNRFPEQQRKFLVNEYQKPRFDKELDFNRTTYGPGDEVQARCKARAADVGPLKDCPVQATVRIDGRTFGADGKENAQPMTFRTDAEGAVTVRFKLPAQIERGQASLTVRFQEEPLVRTIPIVLKKLNVEFYPEGGYLVSGVPNRVYFQARTPLGKPAELKGRLLEDGKPLDAVIETLHDDKEPGVNQGMGSFEFTPQAGHKYEVQVERPVGIEGRLALPEPAADKVALSVPRGVVGAGEDISVVVYSAKPRSLLVGAYCRGQLLDSTKIEAGHFEGNKARATLHPATGAGGVCRVTVFEALEAGGNRRELRPVAERLIYRQPAERLQLKVQPDRAAYVPRQDVKLGIGAVDEKGEAAAAVVMVAVVDKSVVTLADEKTARSMPTHLLLTTEVRRPEDLEYADFLVGAHPRAAEVLDALLGTQGWRRFAEQEPAKFRQEHKEEAERLLVLSGQSSEKTTDFAQQQLQRVALECAAKEARLGEEIAEVREGAEQAEHDPQYKAALAALAGYDDFFDGLKRHGGWVLAGLLFLCVPVCAVVASRRGLARAVPYWIGAAGCTAALIGVVVLQVELRQRRDAKGAVALATRDELTAAPGGAPHAALAKNAAAAPPAAPPAGVGGGAAPAPPAPRMAPQAAARRAGPAARAEKLDAVPRGPEEGGEGKDKNLLADDGRKRDRENRALPQAGQRMIEKERAQLAMPARQEQAKKGAMRMDRPVPGMGGFGGRGPVGRGMAGPAGQLQPRLRAAGAGEPDGDQLPPLPPLVVREYAHNPPPPADPTQRTDFTETLFWQPVLVLPDGKAEVSFRLCDSVTSFQVTAFAHTLDGRLGSATHLLESRLPVVVRPRTPLEVTAGDRVEIPVAVTNNTNQPRKVALRLKDHDNLELQGPAEAEVQLGPEATVRKFFTFRPKVQQGQARVAFLGQPEGMAADAAALGFRVMPQGFPIVAARSDVLEKSATQAVELPATWVKGTLQCQVSVYPSTLADLQKGLDALLREPCGCFEQTSTSNYPNLLILDYLKQSDQSRPEVERRARDLLARGYEKLTSFECTNTARKAKEGYEWFGGTAPAHEALTAYGLMEFRDMARVYDVDPAMLERTRSYLLSRRDGKGGFQRNPRALDTFGAAPEDITNAYIVWSLTEGGKDDDVTKELEALAKKAESSRDPYFLALVANSLINRARTADGAGLLKKVAAAQKDDGHLDAETTSITHSGGRDLQIETTALAVLGWLKANPGQFQQPVQKAIKWIGQQRGGYGGFGSTQSTILALKALIAYTKANRKTAEAGTLELFVNDRSVAKLDFPAGAPEALTLAVPDAEQVLRPGKNRVRIDITGKNVFPYTLTCSYQTLQPTSAADCPVRLDTHLAKAEATEGESVRMSVKVENVSGKGQGMAVAIVGLPGGLALPEDLKQLKEYIRVPEDGGRPLVSAFEVRGRELVLYWRDLAPGQKIEVPLDVVCRVPGEYSGPASRAYLYYNADHKHWVEPLKMTIAARPE
jgi:anti-sigma factor RsiW